MVLVDIDNEEPIVNQYRIGHVAVFENELRIYAMNPVEGSLLKEVIRLLIQ